MTTVLAPHELSGDQHPRQAGGWPHTAHHVPAYAVRLACSVAITVVVSSSMVGSITAQPAARAAGPPVACDDYPNNAFLGDTAVAARWIAGTAGTSVPQTPASAHRFLLPPCSDNVQTGAVQ